MEEYRAYIIGLDGHIINRIDIRCSDQNEARRLAKAPSDRLLERFEPALRSLN